MIKRCDKGNLHSFEDVPIKTEESEVESEIDAIFSSQRSVKAEEMDKFACETDY